MSPPSQPKNGQDEKLSEALRDHLRIGVHWDTDPLTVDLGGALQGEPAICSDITIYHMGMYENLLV